MISVIVPVYKAESYIHRCINSILAQSYTDFELLLIDDGSPDNCGAICDDYATKDYRVRVFHKNNGGVSSARNLGIDNAKGEWITFVDVDDWIEVNHLHCLFTSADADLIIGGIKAFSNNVSVKFEDKLYGYDSLIGFITNNKGYGINTPWGNLMRRSIIKEHNIKFDENIRFTEDTVFNLEYLSYCKSIRTISYCGYNYWDYEISNDACEKYKLSIDEIYYTLSKLISLNNKLGDIWGGKISSNEDCASMFGMISLEGKLDNQTGLDFFKMCKSLSIVKDWNEFLNNELCSPIFQGISQLKYLYQIGSYDKAKDLYYKLVVYIDSDISPLACRDHLNRGLRFRCKDFYIWYFLIIRKNYRMLDSMMKFYMNAKNIYRKIRH